MPAEPKEHDLLRLDEDVEISHRQALAEFMEHLWPAYQQYGGFSMGEALITFRLQIIYNQLRDIEDAIKDKL